MDAVLTFPVPGPPKEGQTTLQYEAEHGLELCHITPDDCPSCEKTTLWACGSKINKWQGYCWCLFCGEIERV